MSYRIPSDRNKLGVKRLKKESQQLTKLGANLILDITMPKKKSAQNILKVVKTPLGSD